MQATFKISRFDPSVDRQPRYQEYTVEVEPVWRILDALNEIKWKQDGTVTYRRSCLHGVCGSDAIMINGKNGLACQELIQDYRKPVFTLDPLPGYPVIKDLVVDMGNFYRNLGRVRPFFECDLPEPAKERRQSIEEQGRIEEAVKCILCGACTGSCPSYWWNPDYLGPAALVKAARFVLDTRDTSAEDRMRVLNDSDGLWRCHTVLNCNAACPKEIDINAYISRVRRKVADGAM